MYRVKYTSNENGRKGGGVGRTRGKLNTKDVKRVTKEMDRQERKERRKLGREGNR